MSNYSINLTTYNEEDNIDILLDSIAPNLKYIDEVIFVDGGSTDGTYEILKEFTQKYSNAKLYLKKGNISVGRNEAIRKSNNDIILTTDAGCKINSNWIKQIIKPFKDPSIDVVAGYYDIKTINNFQKALSFFIGLPLSKIKGTFIPSTRSAAFRKEVWKEVGEFDESLENTGEDTKFFAMALKQNKKFYFAKKARVEWSEFAKINFKNAFYKISHYAYGDAKTNIWIHPTKGIMSHNIKILTIYLRYLIMISLVYFWHNSILPFYIPIGIFIAYLYYPIWKFKDETKNGSVVFWLPVVQIWSDIAVMYGFFLGLLGKSTK